MRKVRMLTISWHVSWQVWHEEYLRSSVDSLAQSQVASQQARRPVVLRELRFRFAGGNPVPDDGQAARGDRHGRGQHAEEGAAANLNDGGAGEGTGDSAGPAHRRGG